MESPSWCSLAIRQRKPEVEVLQGPAHKCKTIRPLCITLGMLHQAVNPLRLAAKKLELAQKSKSPQVNSFTYNQKMILFQLSSSLHWVIWVLVLVRWTASSTSSFKSTTRLRAKCTKESSRRASLNQSTPRSLEEMVTQLLITKKFLVSSLHHQTMQSPISWSHKCSVNSSHRYLKSPCNRCQTRTHLSKQSWRLPRWLRIYCYLASTMLRLEVLT
jgi:hypothetical protein